MPIVIVGDNRLVLDGLKEVVAAGIGGPVLCAASLEQAVADVSRLQPPTLVLIDYEMAARAMDLRHLRERFPEGTLHAVFGAPASAEESMRLLQLGYHGYLPRSMSASAIICAVQLILKGERFVPSVTLDARVPVVGPLHTPGVCLSPRQRQILAMVATGASNKHIARALSVEEVTVKSHIKAIFRKLDVRSRTEAARYVYSRAGADHLPLH